MAMKKLLLLIFCLLATPASAARLPHGGGSGTPNTGGMLINLASNTYDGGWNSLLNWWNSGEPVRIDSTIHGTLNGAAAWNQGYFDNSTGELVAPVPADVSTLIRGFFTPVGNGAYQYAGTPGFAQFAGQQWDVTWEGCATSAVFTTGSIGTGGTSSFPGGNSGTITFGSGDFGQTGIAFDFTTVPACRSNPPHNIKVFQHEYAANVARGEVWNPDWLNDIKQFHILRLMDWGGVNGGGITDFSQLADLNYTAVNKTIGVGWAFSVTVTGDQMTVGGIHGPLVIGSIVNCPNCPANTTILSGPADGGAGVYTLSASFSQSSTDIVTVPPVGTFGDFGPKGGMHPSMACSLANAANTNIEYPIMMAATDAFVTAVATYFKGCMNPGLKVKYSYVNENWNPGFPQFAYDRVQSPISGWNYGGYRAAQVMELIYNVYGAGQRSRWIGTLGSQLANIAVSLAVIDGANSWVTGGSAYSLTQLFDQVDVASYFGPFTGGEDLGQGIKISDVTAGAAPTVTASGHTYTNGQLIKLFVSGGTMASVLNDVYATVSGVVAGTSFNINIDTTGLIYAGSSNYAQDASLYKLMDQSAALNVSTPATYPTKFSYFAQQLSMAIISGTNVSGPYGTICDCNGNASNNLPTIQSLFKQQALIANSSNLKLGQYEGGNTTQMVPPAASAPSGQLLEYLINYNFESGVTGDSTNSIAGVAAAVYQAFRDVNSAYSAQYDDMSPQNIFGPWGSVRFVPGDEGNPKWQALVTENARGPYVDPTPPAPGTYTYPGDVTNNFHFNSSCNSCTDSFTPVVGTVTTKVIVAYIQWGGGTFSGTLTCGGVTMTQDATESLDGAASIIFSGNLGTGSNTRTCNMVYSGSGSSFAEREFYALTATGLLSGSVQATSTSATISEVKGALIVGATSCPSTWAGSSGVAGGATSVLANSFDTGTNRAAFVMLKANFTSQIFAITPSCNGFPVAAAYR